ncbi:alpha/beta hydrolase (plasmid) [Paracoccus liaowanqingii]|uniref:Alpha/beta hydrolase n=1 Tax=Paracoccus liaowanqingii TaxID=2560053 RepID=A0A4Y5SRP8_9RHOB|nr:alpha/beta hydrolase [Paracoccus liaowanqingii]QDA36182.1 alpha/beta hydrolase [Paracoccus liaowanqingii]
MTSASETPVFVHRGTPIPDPVPPEGTTVLRDIAFGPHPRQAYDLYLPKDCEKPVPVVVFAHGGAWVRRDRRAVRMMHVLNHGFALASIGYRLATDFPFPAQVQDYRQAAAHLVAHALGHGIDPTRVFFSGASAGGHLANLAALAVHEPEFGPTVPVRGVVSIYAPSDLIAMAGPMLGGLDHDAPDAPANQLLGGEVRKHPDLARRASPVTYVSPDAPPFLLLHGDADRVIPFSQSVILDAHLRLAGIESDLIQLKGIGHGAPEFQEPPASDAIAAFLSRHSV